MINTHRETEIANRRRVKTANADPCAVAVLDEPMESREMASWRTTPGHQQREHPVGLQAAQREDERLQRRPVGPLSVVDEQQHRTGGLHRAEELEQRRSNPDRIACTGIPGAEPGKRGASQLGRRAHQLLDDAEGEQLLRLLAARLPEVKTLRLADESMGKRGLADARLAGQQGDPRMAAAHLGGLGKQARQLVASSDERRIRPSIVAGHGEEMLQPIHPGLFSGPGRMPRRCAASAIRASS